MLPVNATEQAAKLTSEEIFLGGGGYILPIRSVQSNFIIQQMYAGH